jgi:FlaA1/EpsC-like NDP-sugar epimerase
LRYGKSVFEARSPVSVSRIGQIVIDSAMVAMTLYGAYFFRFDGNLSAQFQRQLLLILPWAIGLYYVSNLVWGNYRRIWRFFSLRDTGPIARAAGVVFLVSAAWRFGVQTPVAGSQVPFGVLLIHPGLALYGLVVVRITRRLVYNRQQAKQSPTHPEVRKRLLLVGAGEAGLLLLHELRKGDDLEIVGFVDDDYELHGRTIGEWRVLGTTRDLETIARTHRVDEVILCMPSAPKIVLQRIVAHCERISLKVSSVPTLWEMLSAKVAIAQLRPVRMEDLLGRHTVSQPREMKELADSYRGCRVLVTGAGGSIGSELVRQLCQFQPAQVILLDKDENNLYEIASEIRENFEHVVEVIADIRSRKSLEKVFDVYRPEVVFHAAAYKHVPLMEHYPAEAILNNVVGTRHVADLSETFGVKIFVLVSTDKAVNPSSIMGASKRVAEMLVQSRAAGATQTRFCCVRFGNVLGSRASVVPIFQRQIRQGRNITVTHPEVRRYFMTIPEAVQLVIQAGSLGRAGEVFLLDMGDPVKIVDLARNLIELSGLTLGKDVTLEFTGLRPGEKLDEELLIAGEQGVRSTKYSKIFVVEALPRDWTQLHAAVAALEHAANAGDSAAIHQALRALNIGYQGARSHDGERAALSSVESAKHPRQPGRLPSVVEKKNSVASS